MKTNQTLLRQLRKFFLALSTFYFLLLTCQAQAQVPQRFNYQGIARDAKGKPFSQQSMSLKLAILPTADATQAEYEEIQTVTTNEFGLYTLQIGNGTATLGDMKSVKWEAGNKYIRVAIDPNGGQNYTEAGTTQLLSVPYALYADRAGSAKSGSERTGAVNSNATHVAGDANFVTKFTALNVIGKSRLFDNGTSVAIGTASPDPGFTFHLRRTTNGGHILMENPTATSFGTFRMINDIPSNFATFTKYGSTFPGGYTGIADKYPFANMLGYGNNGPFLNAGTGNIGFAITKAGTNKLKIHIDASTERLGLGGNAVPQAQLHVNNTASGNDTMKFTNQTTGHNLADGTELRLNGNDTRLINRENGSLEFGTNNSIDLSIAPTGNVELSNQIKIAGGNPGAGKVLVSDTAGLASWEHLSPASGTIHSISSNSSLTLTPTSTVSFLTGSRLIVVITSPTQTVHLSTTVALGSTLVGGAFGLSIYPAYNTTNLNTPVTLIGGGITGLSCKEYTRQTYTINTTVTGLTPGTYYFGMAGASPSTNWNSNEFAYSSVFVVN